MIKKLFAATAVAVLPLCSIGQTFMTTSSGVIPDNNTAVCFDVVVSGLPAQIDPSFGISMVCLDLTHTYDGDIRIFLKAPDNSIVVLSNHNGGSGDNYTSTCFAENGANGWIMQGGAPFTGNWYPEYSLNTFNNGMDPNGTWQICIHDEVPADSGYFNFGTITFSANPPPDPGPPPVCNTTVATTCECPDTTMTDCDLLPDMTASAVIIQQQHTEYTDYLTLSNATPNIGYGPLEIRGINVCYCDTQVVGCATPICPDGSYPKQMITQRVYHKSGTTMTYADYPSGTMTYHPNHGHMHVDNWAIYTLRKATSDPLPTNWPIIGRGSKVSYCLVNLGSCTGSPGYCVDSLGNTILGADLPNLGLGAVTGCGNEQGIYVGSLDVYGQGLYGQQIDFPGICNDDYYVVSETDPLNNFLETNDNNNWAAVPITLSLQGVGPANPSFIQTANGLTVDFSSNVPGVTSYKYFFGDGDSSNVPVVSHTYAVAGTYTVVLELFNGVCTATVAQVVTATGTTGFSEAIVTDVNLIPNPFSESSEISFELSSATQLELSVYDLKGSLVSTLHNGMMPAGKQRIPITGLNAGTYVVRMQTAKTVSNHRLVKL